MSTRQKLERACRKLAAIYAMRKHPGKHMLAREAVELKVPASPVESLVIPVVGETYVGEGVLAARFAERFFPQLKEVLIVTDCAAALFAGAPAATKIKTLDVECLVPAGHAYSQIFRSRLIKILGPLQAAHERILMTDSDLNILRPLSMPFAPMHVMGSFRHGKMISKVYRSRSGIVPNELKGTYRAFLWDHLNGAFLAATKSTWMRLSPLWFAEYLSIWNKLPDDQPPTDQVALCSALDKTDIATVDLGDWVNWPVAKKIGGRSAAVPPEVCGAHGGFPISEWEKYLLDPGAELRFMSPEEMGKLRYLNDSQRAGGGSS